jgi:hypothetical protein
VPVAVDLDQQLRFDAGEVDDERADWVLTAELHA